MHPAQNLAFRNQAAATPALRSTAKIVQLQRPPMPTAAFAPINLDQLNAKAAMLERLDNKYVITRTALLQAIPRFAEHFDILEIDGVSDFGYETCYFDDANRTSYFDHQGKRRKRWKVRTRLYVDAGLCFVEIKLKDKRGKTIKKRLRCQPDEHRTLDAAALEHIHTAYTTLYGAAFEYELAAVINMRYQRLTFVAKEGGERMTVDHSLKFWGAEASGAIDPDVFIIETKSRNANGRADKILRAVHQHPTKHCSKYCAGMAAINEVNRCNRFLPALRKLGVEPWLLAA